MVDSRYAEVRDKLKNNRPLLENIAEQLLEKETLDEKEFKTLLEEHTLIAESAPQE